MKEQGIKNHIEKMKDEFLNTGAHELTKVGNEGIRALIQEIKE